MVIKDDAYRVWIAHARAIVCLCAALLFFSPTACLAQQVLLFHDVQDPTIGDKQIASVAMFLGLNVRTVDSGRGDIRTLVRSSIATPTTVAILISETELNHLDRARTLGELEERHGRRIPILVYDITAATPASELKTWSGGAVVRCIAMDPALQTTAIQVEERGPITRQLGGRQLPPVNRPACGLEAAQGSGIQTVLSALQNDGKRRSLLVRATLHSQEVFFLARTISQKPFALKNITSLADAFSSVAPFTFFLSYAAGEYAWHTDAHYANLTIDDAWLTQPYGYLDYRALLVEMEKHRFHTTIAFIPWNFDRSSADVVELFRSHPNRYSVCVHGNNHAHREFEEYTKTSLDDQIADIKQGVARMERFTALTHVPYDRFMVFPHAVAPEPTFAALRIYGFLGTANSSNVPLGALDPHDPMFFMRPYTADYGGLLSFYRYPSASDIPQLDLAVHAYLGNPILFYDHSSLFGSGIAAFDSHADFVNRLQPDTKWAGLGEIARHSYLVRKRADGDTDVLMLSSEMEIVNPGNITMVFHIHRDDPPGVHGRLTADGSLAGMGASTESTISIPAHGSRLLRVTYPNDLDLSHEKVSNRSPYVYTLRMISDFRDMHLSKSPLGGSLIRRYYQYRLDSAERFLERRWWILLALLMFGYFITRHYDGLLHARHGARH